MNAKNLLVAAFVAAAACSKDKASQTKTGDTAAASTATAAAAPGAASTTASSTTPFVGTHYDPMPAGVVYQSGTVILGSDGKPSAFVLSHVSTPKGLMVWLDETLPDDGVIRRRVVRATMDDPPIEPGQRRVIGTCGINGKFNGDILAIVKEVPERRYKTVYHAWRANPAAARFDSISTEGVTCEEPGGGDMPANR